MEFLLNFLKHVYGVLSTTEFIVFIFVIGLFAFGLVKFLLRMSGKSGIIAEIVNSEKNGIDDVVEKLDGIVTKEIHNEALTRILQAIEDLKTQTNENDESLKNKMADILTLKKDVEAISESINREINELKHQLKLYDSQNHQANESMKEILQRLQDLIQRILSQIDKIDEFTRAAIPEFRSYHKELSKEVSELNRDIALVERTIHTQINTSSAINLR